MGDRRQSSVLHFSMKDQRSNRDRRVKQLNEHCDLFKGIDYHVLSELFAQCPVISYGPGHILLKKRDINDKLFIIISGSITVHLMSPSEEADFRIMSGDCFGEMSMIDKKPASAFIVTEKGCRVLVLNEKKFWNDFIPIPIAAYNLLQIQTTRDHVPSSGVISVFLSS